MYVSRLLYPHEKQLFPKRCDPRFRKESHKKKIPCRYHFKSGFCHFGDRCKFSHEEKIKPCIDQQDHMPSKLCKYFQQGECKYGEQCFYLHSSTEAKDGKVKENSKEKENKHNGDSLVCSICLEEAKGKVFGLLEACDHCYCAECIYRWQRTNGKLSCALCRKESRLLLRSEKYIRGKEKKEYFDKFLQKAAKKNCYRYMRSHCNKGDACIYKHDPAKQKPALDRFRRQGLDLGGPALMRAAAEWQQEVGGYEEAINEFFGDQNGRFYDSLLQLMME